jgi:2-keto-4-pentenoate hydratase/2-oxohepta-3-ene-1,7-dioic acid hydratase in catechol pathway
MYFNIPDTLEFISKYSTLHPGDMILTGTPIGLGPVKIEDQLYANIEQEGKVIMDMRFNVEEDK